MDKSDYKYVAWKTLNGWNITSRCETKDELIADIAYWEAEYANGSAIPAAKTVETVAPKTAPVTDVCPVCGSATIASTSKDGTKKFIKCSTNKWNRDTQQAEGCNYIKWL